MGVFCIANGRFISLKKLLRSFALYVTHWSTTFGFGQQFIFIRRLVKLQLFCKASVDELLPYVQCSFLLFSVILFFMAITPFIFRIILKVTLKCVLFQ